MKPHKLTPVALALTLASGVALAAPATEQLPATKHQAEAIGKVEQKSAQTPDATKTMPATEHQEDVIRRFDAADTNRDGMLSRNEYQTHMRDLQRDAARHYNKSLQSPEQPGVEAGGPRDREEAEQRSNPVQ